MGPGKIKQFGLIPVAFGGPEFGGNFYETPRKTNIAPKNGGFQ